MSRERELAVRAALGAGRERIVRQIVTESIVLSAIGGLVGVVVAIVAVPGLTQLVPNSLPIAQQPSVDLRVLLFAGALIVLTGLAFSVIPAMRAAGASALAGLRDGVRAGGGVKQRVRSVLVVIEVMASVVLLISSGLLVRAMWRLQAIDPGFRSANVVTLSTALPWPKYEDPRSRERFYTKVLGDVRGLPGVQSAAYVGHLPMAMRGGIWPVITRGATESIRSASTTASLRFTTPQFFSTLQIPLLQGRDVDETDTNGKPNAAVVSESFVKRYWPNEQRNRQTVQVRDARQSRRGCRRRRACAGTRANERAAGLFAVHANGFCVAQLVHAEGSGHSIDDAARDVAPGGETHHPRSRSASADLRRAHDGRDRRQRDGVAPRAVAHSHDLGAVALVLSAVGIHGLLSFTVRAGRVRLVYAWRSVPSRRR